jgi:NAD(P)-dependent dehydrogenase (short-subunit alcohol dehydrogenase family)
MTLNGKIILVTGGANGIGAATARECAARGATVLIADRDQANGSAVAAEIGAPFFPVDVTDERSVQALFAQIAARYHKLNVVLHTAGILKGAFVPLQDFSAATWHQVLDVNTFGSFLCAKHALPLLTAAGGGVLVLVSSMAAIVTSSSYAYGASKAALNNLGNALATNLAPANIRVNVVSPGGIDTEMKRSVIAAELEKKGKSLETDFAQAVSDSGLGAPEGVARVLAWLASDEADYVRGVVYTR